jgi:hypothetical protein
LLDLENKLYEAIRTRRSREEFLTELNAQLGMADVNVLDFETGRNLREVITERVQEVMAEIAEFRDEITRLRLKIGYNETEGAEGKIIEEKERRNEGIMKYVDKFMSVFKEQELSLENACFTLDHTHDFNEELMDDPWYVFCFDLTMARDIESLVHLQFLRGFLLVLLEVDFNARHSMNYDLNFLKAVFDRCVACSDVRFDWLREDRLTYFLQMIAEKSRVDS